MVHDFILVYALDSGVGSQEDVLRRLAGSDCADATVGWGRPGHVGLAFSREASDRDAAVKLATAQMAQALPGAVLVRADALVFPDHTLPRDEALARINEALAPPRQTTTITAS